MRLEIPQNKFVPTKIWNFLSDYIFLPKIKSNKNFWSKKR